MTYDPAVVAYVIGHARQLGFPEVLQLAVAWQESKLDPNAAGDNNLSWGLYQAHIPAHGGTPADWVGLSGADRIVAEMRDRWVRTFARLGGRAAFEADPVGFFYHYHPAAQGAEQISYEDARGAIEAATQIWMTYQGGEGPPRVSDLFLDAATGWMLPANGPITQFFGENPQKYPKSGGIGHPGIDIGAPYGSDVLAVRDGRVTYAGWFNGDGLPINDPTGYGLLVRVTDVEGTEHWYGHNAQTLVSLGDWVTRGQRIALVGNTGRATGPHCHYEIRIGGVITNPEPWLNLGAVLVYGSVTAQDGVNLRSDTRVADDTFVMGLPRGTRFAIAQDAWIPVVVNGRRGFIKVGDLSRAWVSIDGADAPPPAPPTPPGRGRTEDLGGLRFQRDAFMKRAQKAGDVAKLTKELSDELLYEAATVDEKVRQAEAVATEPQG